MSVREHCRLYRAIALLPRARRAILGSPLLSRKGSRVAVLIRSRKLPCPQRENAWTYVPPLLLVCLRNRLPADLATQAVGGRRERQEQAVALHTSFYS